MRRRRLAAAGCGILFGVGLALSGMAFPQKVLNFLDVAGNWHPSLLLVLGGAVGVTLVAFPLILNRSRPVCDEAFESPPAERLSPRLFAGAALFGVGWGLCGYCPGPGIVSLGRFAPDAFVFTATFLVGSWLYRFVKTPGWRQAFQRDSESPIRAR